MSDFHDVLQPHHIREDRFPSKKEQLNLIQGYVEHGLANFDDENLIQTEVERLREQAVDWRPCVSLHWCIWGVVQAVVDPKSDLKARETEGLKQGVYKFIEEGENGDKVEQDSVLDTSAASPPLSQIRTEEVEDEEDLFDYVSYAAEKAQLFWSDLIMLGIVDQKDYKGLLKSIVDN